MARVLSRPSAPHAFTLSIPKPATPTTAAQPRGAHQRHLSSRRGGCEAAPHSTTPSKQPQRSAFEATQILPRLYLGAYSDVTCGPEELAAHGITHILNTAAEECPTAPEGFTTKMLKLRDDSDENIALHFDQCLQFIHGALANGGGVLVHCRMGVSRSATIVLAYLMCHGMPKCAVPPMSYPDAFDYVKTHRPQVSPNLGFVLALHTLDEKMGRGSTPNTPTVGSEASPKLFTPLPAAAASWQ